MFSGHFKIIGTRYLLIILTNNSNNSRSYDFVNILCGSQYTYIVRGHFTLDNDKVLNTLIAKNIENDSGAHGTLQCHLFMHDH